MAEPKRYGFTKRKKNETTNVMSSERREEEQIWDWNFGNYKMYNDSAVLCQTTHGNEALI